MNVHRAVLYSSDMFSVFLELRLGAKYRCFFFFKEHGKASLLKFGVIFQSSDISAVKQNGF